MSDQPTYKPGDVANGHVLNSDGTWVPVAQPYGAPVPPPKKKPIWTRWWMVTAYVLVGLMVIGGIAGGGDETKASDKTPVAAAKDEPAAEPGDEPAQEEAAEPSAEPAAEEEAEEEPKAEPKPKPKPEAVAVKAAQIVKEFEDNELAADTKYKGKTLKITGVVDNIDTDIFDDEKYILSLGGGGDFEFLFVNCNDMSTDELSTLNKGQTVTVIGEFDDGGDLGVEVKDCHLP
jgi:hypothetical protein